MKKKIGVVTRNAELARKIELLLGEEEVTIVDNGSLGELDRVFYDVDTCGDTTGYYVRMSVNLESGDNTLHLPFRFSEFRRALEANTPKNAYLGIDRVNSSAILGSEKIKLTDVEMRLYERLYDADEYVSREELLEHVWHGSTDAGVLNVYVHYLREKLEKKGEKIILSSRKLGYKINEIYREVRNA